MERKENRGIATNIAKYKGSKVLTALNNYYLDNETCKRFIGITPDAEPEELWQEELPLTDLEIEVAMRMNNLKIMYLVNEQQQILWCGEKYDQINDTPMEDFLCEMAKCIIDYGQDYVFDCLEPLGFRVEDYAVTKRIKGSNFREVLKK